MSERILSVTIDGIGTLYCEDGEISAVVDNRTGIPNEWFIQKCGKKTININGKYVSKYEVEDTTNA
jgi:hypothetical protein